MQFMSIGGVWVCFSSFKLDLMFPWEQFSTWILLVVGYNISEIIYFWYWISFLFDKIANFSLLLPNNRPSRQGTINSSLKDEEHTQTPPIGINNI